MVFCCFFHCLFSELDFNSGALRFGISNHIVPINQDRLRTMQAVVLLKKMIKAHKRENYESAERLRKVIAGTLA